LKGCWKWALNVSFAWNFFFFWWCPNYLASPFGLIYSHWKVQILNAQKRSMLFHVHMLLWSHYRKTLLNFGVFCSNYKSQICSLNIIVKITLLIGIMSNNKQLFTKVSTIHDKTSKLWGPKNRKNIIIYMYFGWQSQFSSWICEWIFA
jgi:hypothetical protein